jgi:limonene-1,2-epoxide hydrolase
MTESERIDVVRRFCEAWSEPTFNLPKILDFFADDCVYHNMPLQPIQGKDAIKGVIEQFMGHFERCDWELIHVAAASDIVLTERVDRFLGEKTVELPVMGAFEVKDGKIVAWRDYFDLATWTKQMS